MQLAHALPCATCRASAMTGMAGTAAVQHDRAAAVRMRRRALKYGRPMGAVPQAIAAGKAGHTGDRRAEPPLHAHACRIASRSARDAAAKARRTAEALGEWAAAADEVAGYWATLAKSSDPSSSHAAGRVCATTRAASVMDASTVGGLYAGYRAAIEIAHDRAIRAAAVAGIRFDIDVKCGGRP